jgi:hypothetical protein
VWGRIEEQLDKRQRRPAAWFWWMAAGILLGLTGWWLMPPSGEKKKDPGVPQAMPKTERFAPLHEETGAERITKKPDSPFLLNKAVETAPYLIARQRLPESLPADGPMASHSFILPAESTIKNVLNAGPASETASGISLASPVSRRQEMSPPPGLDQALLYPLSSIPAPVSSLALKTPEGPVILPPAAPAGTAITRRLDLGVAVGPTFVMQSVGGKSNAGQNLVFSEKIHTVHESRLGLNLGLSLSPRWRMEAGLSRQKMVQHTSHSANLRLMDGVCLNPDDPGIKNYEFHYSLLSGANRSEVTVLISQVDPHVSMPADEPFTLQMQTTRKSVEWLLPVSVQRIFGRGRWQASLRGGVALGWSGKSSLEVHHFTEQCVDLCFKTGHKPQVTANAVKSMSARYLTGAGIQFHLTPRIRLAVEPVLDGTLFNIRGNGRQTKLALNGQAIYTF